MRGHESLSVRVPCHGQSVTGVSEWAQDEEGFPCEGIPELEIAVLVTNQQLRRDRERECVWYIKWDVFLI